MEFCEKLQELRKKTWTDAGRTGGAALRFPHGDLKMGVRAGVSKHRFSESDRKVFLRISPRRPCLRCASFRLP